MDITDSPVPRHIGIIMDGNRRFAKRLMMKPWKGHEWGAKKVESLMEWCREYGVKELTLYTFSVQNFDRPKEEFDYLMALMRENFKKIKSDERIFKHKIRMNFIGRLWMFPTDIQLIIKELMDLTKSHDNYTINFAFGYGGREEVIDAVKRLAEQVKKGKVDIDKINEQSFSDYLYMKDEPDLIIRTGGEKRTSNFLLYQGAYSELIFIDKFWPEFEKEDFIYCLEEYKKRERRFGK